MEELESGITAEDQEQKKALELLEESQIEEALSNNEIVFKYDNTNFRVRKPTFQEKQEVFRLRSKMYVDLLRNEDYMLESDLIAIYKKRNIDIKQLDEDVLTLEQEKKQIYIKLGKSLKDKEGDDVLKAFRENIIDITTRQHQISLKKIDYLQYSIETQVMIFIYTYLAWLVSEKEETDNKWVRVFATFEEFQSSREQITYKLAQYASLLIKHELEVT